MKLPAIYPRQERAHSDALLTKTFFRPKREALYGLLFLLPGLSGIVLFVVTPFLDVLRRSFTSAMSGKFVGLQNYRTVMENQAFLLAAKNTARFMLVCMPLLIFLSLVIALMLFRAQKGSGIFKSIFLIPMAIPVASVALLWKTLFHRNGFLSVITTFLGIGPQDWMNSEAAFWVLVASYIWKNLGYDIVLWLAGLSAISPDLFEAAAIDGAGPVRTFWKIALPNLLPHLFTITVLSFLNSFKVFREAYLVAGDYPHTSMYLLQHLFNNWFRELSMDKLAAAAVIVALVILFLILLLRRAWDMKQ